MIQLVEQAQESIELAEYQEVSHMDSMPGDNENELIFRVGLTAAEQAQN